MFLDQGITFLLACAFPGQTFSSQQFVCFVSFRVCEFQAHDIELNASLALNATEKFKVISFSF